MPRSEHTPGPWNIRRSSILAHIGPDSETIADEVATCWDRTNMEANARLIAAAPDMLEALEGLLQEATDHVPLSCLKAAADAIAKARGEE